MDPKNPTLFGQAWELTGDREEFGVTLRNWLAPGDRRLCLEIIDGTPVRWWYSHPANDDGKKVGWTWPYGAPAPIVTYGERVAECRE